MYNFLDAADGSRGVGLSAYKVKNLVPGGWAEAGLMAGAQLYADSNDNYNGLQRALRAGAVGLETALVESVSDWVGLAAVPIAGKPGFVAASFSTGVVLDQGWDWVNSKVFFPIIGGGNKR
jgi:hypothetical protein